MKKYNRRIGNIIINILIDDSIFEKKYKIVDSFLRSYSLFTEKIFECDKEYFYYIYDKDKSEETKNKYCTICDIHNNDWVFLLMSDLEVFYAQILKCTVIHGSCIRINNKNILFMGERWSGKTTLTQYLAIDKNGEYLDDDCVYVVDSSYIGFAMPLPMRNVTNLHYNECFIAQTIDSDDIMRTLYSPPKYANHFKSIDIVVFPKYGADSINRIEKMTQAEAFNKIIKNIRAYDEMKTMFIDIKNLATNCDCYNIQYSSSDSAYKLLFSEDAPQ